MPNPPPLAPSTNPPLRKFTLHPPSLTAPNSPLVLAANGTGALPPAALQALRQTLSQARQSAAERIGIRDANRRNLTERQANEKRVAEEQARMKEAERRRKREEDERREKERVERTERERTEREREEGAQRKKEEEEYQAIKKAEEDDKRRKDEEERQAVVKRAREMKEKKRAEEVLELVKASDEKRALDPSTTGTTSTPHASQQDVKMEDAPSVNGTPAPPPPPIPLAQVGATDSVPSIAIGSSPEVDDDFGQPKVPLRNHDKKKRKRDQIIDSDASDSDGEDSQPLIQKARKLESKASTNGPTSSPTPQPNGTPRHLSLTLNGAPTAPQEDPYAGLSVIERKLKEDKYVKHSIPIRPPAPGTATAFYLPTHSLVPPKPVSVPPAPTPKRQADVRGDFSVAKPGAQIAHHTFHTWADAYLRPFGEDDLAFLAPKTEDINPYLIPPLGKHYTERWEEEDSNLPIASTSSYASPLEPPPLLRTRPEHLTEDALGAENIFLGPLSERLVAALAFQEEGEESEEDVEMGEARRVKVEGGDGEVGVESALVERKVQLDAVDLEERIKRELRFIGILPDDDVDWSSREDDEISSALRACQRELHHQTALNEARKVILTSIVKDRMAYQDYETTRDAQERIIENGWTKRQRSGKKKTKGKERDKGRPAASAEDGTKGPISLSLLEALDKRNKLVGTFRPFFEEEEDQGRFQGIPEKSVYEGLEELLAKEEEEDEEEAGRLGLL